jgi:uncharacterized protein YijF (DUF1287 family)
MNETIIKAGDKVAWKIETSSYYQGVVIGRASAEHMVRVKLRCGQFFNAAPHALKKIKEFNR